MFGALKRGRFRSLASLILVVNVVGKLQQKRTRAASRGFLAAARLSCMVGGCSGCRLHLARAYVWHRVGFTRSATVVQPFVPSPSALTLTLWTEDLCLNLSLCDTHIGWGNTGHVPPRLRLRGKSFPAGKHVTKS